MRGDQAHQMIGVKRDHGGGERIFGGIPVARRRPGGLSDQVGDAVDIEQQARSLSRFVGQPPVEFIRQPAGAAGQPEVHVDLGRIRIAGQSLHNDRPSGRRTRHFGNARDPCQRRIDRPR